MDTALKEMLRRLGLLRAARAIRDAGGRGRRGICRMLKIVPHQTAERRRYWEARGEKYFEEVGSILTDKDPYYHAQQEFLRQLRAIAWDSALEVGCGFGWHLRAIRRQHPEQRIAGIDFSFSQLRRGRRYLNGSGILLAQADAGRLPFADNAFDLVFTSGLLMYIHPTRLPDVLNELARVARRSVMLLEYAREHMNSPVRQALMEQAPWHGHRYGTALARAGLRLVQMFPFQAFEAYPHRIPLSFVHGEKDAAPSRRAFTPPWQPAARSDAQPCQAREETTRTCRAN